MHISMPVQMCLEETIHLFFYCKINSQVWNFIHSIFAIPPYEPTKVLDIFAHWFKFNFYNKNHIRILIPIIVCWEIWMSRNTSKHDGKVFNHQNIIAKIIKHLYSIHLAFKWCYKDWMRDFESARRLGISIFKQKPKIIIAK